MIISKTGISKNKHKLVCQIAFQKMDITCQNTSDYVLHNKTEYTQIVNCNVQDMISL